MRTIKFRMWNNCEDKTKSKMFYDVDNVMACLTQQCNFEYGKYGYNHIGDGNVFMQFTGIQDKNGFDIYEGDICVWEVNGITRTAAVYYDELQASFWMGKSKETGLLTLNDWMRGTHEVIGNIHENTELL